MTTTRCELDAKAGQVSHRKHLITHAGMRRVRAVGYRTRIRARGGFRATFFHLDVPELFSQATASDFREMFRSFRPDS
jgi:hypothetical protein